MRIESKPFYADLFSRPSAADVPRVEPPAPRRPAKAALPAPFPASVPEPGPAPAGDDRPRPGRPAPPPTSNGPRALPAPRPADDAPGANKAGTAADAPTPARPGRRQTLSLLRQLIGDVDVHRLTPRQMADLSLDLYAAGALSFDDYSALAFQPELHPDYTRTIGALTGEPPRPDRPRDFVREWEDRAAFLGRHDTGRPELADQSRRIAGVLRQIETPTDVFA